MLIDFGKSIWLVVSTNPSDKYESDWIIIPTIGENKIHVPNHQPDGHFDAGNGDQQTEQNTYIPCFWGSRSLSSFKINIENPKTIHQSSS
jgi:hypothetical protein